MRFRRRDSSTCAPVSRHGEGASRRALCLSVALKDEAAQSGSEEGQHGGGDGSRGRQGEAQVPTKTGLEQEQKARGQDLLWELGTHPLGKFNQTQSAFVLLDKAPRQTSTWANFENIGKTYIRVRCTERQKQLHINSAELVFQFVTNQIHRSNPFKFKGPVCRIFLGSLSPSLSQACQ